MQLSPVFRRFVSAHRLEVAIASMLSRCRYAFAERLVTLVMIDGLLILAAVLAVSVVTSAMSHPLLSLRWWYWYVLLTSSWWLVAWLHDLYDVSSPSLYHWNRTVLRVGTAGIICWIVYGLLHFLIPPAYTIRSAIAIEQLHLSVLLALSLILAWRLLYGAMAKTTLAAHRTLIVGQGRRAQIASDLVRQHGSLNYRLVGFLDWIANDTEKLRDGLPIWNNPVDLPQVVQQYGVHELIIATEARLDRQLAAALMECQATGVQVLFLPELYERHHHNLPLEDLDPDWTLNAVRSAPTMVQRVTKRILDLMLVLLALPVLLVVIPLLAVAIKLDSPGPVFYRQVRLGRAGKPFWILKFRTMYVDAEKDGRAQWARKNDPRITRVGRVVRKTRLDELPQVINILRGEMSVIGPRPERPEFVEQLEQRIPYYRARLLVKPGLTGWAQIQYDYTSTIEDSFTKLQYDLYYIHRWSLWLDFYILFRTVMVVTQLKGT